jgi:hypothetical protein
MQSATVLLFAIDGPAMAKKLSININGLWKGGLGPLQRVPATIAEVQSWAGMAHCIAWPQSVPIVMALDPQT